MSGRTDELPFTCCDHCGCGTKWLFDKREGHDDTCSFGCNDAQLARELADAEGTARQNADGGDAA